MRIEQSDVQLSASSWLASLQQTRQQTAISLGPPDPPTASAADRAVFSSSTANTGDTGADVMGDPRLQLMLWAAEIIVGHEIHLFHLPAQGGPAV